MKRPYDPVARAREAWGSEIPPEVVALAEACARSSGREAARLIGYSDAVVSHVLGGKYRKGDLQKVFAKVRGALMGEVVDCPELGPIGRDVCIAWQSKPFAATNSHRVRMFHACRDCPNRQQKDSAS